MVRLIKGVEITRSSAAGLRTFKGKSTGHLIPVGSRKIAFANTGIFAANYDFAPYFCIRSGLFVWSSPDRYCTHLPRSPTPNPIRTIKGIQQRYQPADTAPVQPKNARMFPVSALYIARQMEQALILYRALVNQVTSSRAIANTVAPILGAIAVPASKRRKRLKEAIKDFQPAEELALEATTNPKVNAAGRTKIFETISYGRTLLGLTNPQGPLNKAEKNHQISLAEGSAFAVHEAQIVRTKTLIPVRNLKTDRETVMASVDQGMLFLDGSPYVRFEEQIIAALFARLRRLPDKQLQEFAEDLRRPT